ncbi:cytochrome C protein [Polymorphobacter multimanifer]|uniref:Cytochrome c2 n=1 Tax=Polymorphobacter multimanifer TaxID=1070431 RepID=A0A841L743_9SPHN|nr:cytochrome c family protein [Polymorphobacter multimanifer]MBB6228036.1 cytochrome c2 [Polymorphobacter multimanifer]GGI81447.1 cytochrome C protein [Polymorphobacter multimanifer]
MNHSMLFAAAALLAAAPAAAQMPKGDAAAGEKVFNQCKACHVTTKGVNRVGPSLHAVVGRKSGSITGYKYSAANQKSNVTWDEATLFKYLEAPMKFMPGTKMAFAGLKKPEDRANVIAYLKTQNK